MHIQYKYVLSGGNYACLVLGNVGLDLHFFFQIVYFQ